jgi:hypothetical protein
MPNPLIPKRHPKRNANEDQLHGGISRFLEKLDYTSPGGHWLWKGRIHSYNGTDGYGMFVVCADVHILAHRYSWWIYNGPIPEGKIICHKCDIPGCCNPDHLFLGTLESNNADRHSKGRSKGPSGIQNARAKLTPEKAEEIRRAYVPYKMSAPKLSKIFGVHSSSVYAIVKGETWR